MIIGIIGSEGTYDWKIHPEGKLFQSTLRGGDFQTSDKSDKSKENGQKFHIRRERVIYKVHSLIN